MTYAEFRERRAIRGHGAERAELMVRLRELELSQTHYIILTCGWFNHGDEKLSDQQKEWKAKRIKCEADLKETIEKLDKVCHQPKP